MLALTALSLVPRFLLGFLVIDVVWQARTRSRVVQFFMAGAVGAGISSLLSFLWIWRGLDLQLYAALETVLILLISVLWAWKRRGSLPQAGLTLRRVWPSSNLGWWVCLGVAALMFTVRFWIISLEHPHGSWDAWVHWNVVSRFVYRGGEEWQGTFLRIYDEPDYPLLLAMTNATTWALVQKESTRGPMVLAFFSTVGLVGMLFGLVREMRGTAQACLAAIVMLTHPLLLQNAIGQYADVPAASYFLASAGMLILCLRSHDKSLAVLAGLSAGLGAWAKNEGLVFAAISLAVWSYLGWRRPTAGIRHFLLGALGPFTVLVLFKTFLAPSAQVVNNVRTMVVALGDPARYIQVLHDVGLALWREPGGSGWFMLALAVYALLIGRASQRIAGLPFLLFIFAAQAFAYFLIYVGTPYAYGQAAMIPTSIGRLFVHILPLLILALFLWLEPPPAPNSPGRAAGTASVSAIGSAGSQS